MHEVELAQAGDADADAEADAVLGQAVFELSLEFFDDPLRHLMGLFR